MKNKVLLKQIKHLQKMLPKDIILKPELNDRELTKDEVEVIKSYLTFYNTVNFNPVRGLTLPKVSKNSYLDFAFMRIPFEKDNKFYIYLNIK